MTITTINVIYPRVGEFPTVGKARSSATFSLLVLSPEPRVAEAVPLSHRVRTTRIRQVARVGAFIAQLTRDSNQRRPQSCEHPHKLSASSWVRTNGASEVAAERVPVGAVPNTKRIEHDHRHQDHKDSADGRVQPVVKDLRLRSRRMLSSHSSGRKSRRERIRLREKSQPRFRREDLLPSRRECSD